MQRRQARAACRFSQADDCLHPGFRLDGGNACMDSADFREDRQAFMEKRKP
jgi:hypothetical protein